MSTIKRKDAIDLVVNHYLKEICDSINAGSFLAIREMLKVGYDGVVNMNNVELQAILKESTSIDYTIIDIDTKEPKI